MTTFSRNMRVHFEDCDPAGIIFYPRFFALVNRLVEDWFADELGASFKSLHLDQRKGVPTVQFACDFQSPLRLGDTAEMRRAEFTLEHFADGADFNVGRVIREIHFAFRRGEHDIATRPPQHFDVLLEERVGQPDLRVVERELAQFRREIGVLHRRDNVGIR